MSYGLDWRWWLLTHPRGERSRIPGGIRSAREGMARANRRRTRTAETGKRGTINGEFVVAPRPDRLFVGATEAFPVSPRGPQPLLSQPGSASTIDHYQEQGTLRHPDRATQPSGTHTTGLFSLTTLPLMTTPTQCDVY